eukprot:COSAG05_NODE_20029_length_284_cov_0.789189_1_plen_94_part_11
MDTTCHVGTSCVMVNLLNSVSIFPHDDTWDQMLIEAVHLLKVNQEAELSVQSRMPFTTFYCASLMLAKASVDSSRRASLLETGVAKSLAYIVEH